MSTMNEIVERYIALRDRKAELKALYDRQKEDLEAAMARIEGHLLGKMQEMDMDGLKTPAGTVYKKTTSYANVADWDMFLRDVIEYERWTMLEKRCSKAAIEEFKNAHQDLPPGINWREEITLGIRRS